MPRDNLADQLHRSPQVRTVLEQLLEARHGAEALKVNLWTLAVEMSSLLNTGCSLTELRLLIAAGFADHAEDVTQPSDRDRSFRPEPEMIFGPRSCFVLTEAGAGLVARLAETDATNGAPNDRVGRRVPQWNAANRELSVDGGVVKRFRRPAPTLELVLSAFEEEGWPPHLDDPLPPEHNIDPQQRLRDTVRRLNGCQEPMRIRFESDGLGAGIRWEWARSDSRSATDEPRMSHG